MKKILLILIFFAGIYLTSRFFLWDPISTKLRENKDINILFLSTANEKFQGAYLVNYSLKQGICLVFNVNARTRFIEHIRDNRPIYLQDVYQKIYYKNKRNLELSLLEYIKYIEQIYDIKIDYYLYFNEETIDALNEKFEYKLNKNILFSSLGQDREYLQKSVHIKKFLSQICSITILEFFYQDVFKNQKLKYSNLGVRDLFFIVNNMHSFYNLEVFLVGFRNVITADEKFYIKDMLQSSKIELYEEGEIIAEVLNCSKLKDFAIKITRNLRDFNVDVQRWGNSSEMIDKNLVIDRIGNWKKTLMVAKFIKKLGYDCEVFSNQNKNLFVDLTVLMVDNKKRGLV